MIYFLRRPVWQWILVVLVLLVCIAVMLRELNVARIQRNAHAQFTNYALSTSRYGPPTQIVSREQARNGLWLRYDVSNLNGCFVRSSILLRELRVSSAGDVVTVWPISAPVVALGDTTTHNRHVSYFVSTANVFSSDEPTPGNYTINRTVESDCGTDHAVVTAAVNFTISN